MWDLRLCRLIDRQVPSIIVRILMIWFARQNFYVRWNNSKPSSFIVSGGIFIVSGGIFQVGILSPYLFDSYFDDLYAKHNNVPTGYTFNSVQIIYFTQMMQYFQHYILNVCDDFAYEQELFMWKEFCLCVRPKWLKNITIPNNYVSKWYTIQVHAIPLFNSSQIIWTW